MRIINCEQRSDEWYAARLGVPSASSFGKIVDGSGNASKQQTDYLYKLAAQRLTGTREDTYMSAAMAEGIEREETSRWVYAMESGVVVEEVGFCLSDCGRFGASPDGLVGSEGLVELKNPIGGTAVAYLLNGALPSTYFQQVQGQLLVTGRDWCDFVSYYPNLPLLVIRCYREEEFLSKLEEELNQFCDKLDDICSDLGEKAALTNG